jgi:hypothetical protein
MADIVSDLAEKSGIAPDQAQKGLGAVLSFLKGSVPEESFAQIRAAVPNSEQMMADAGPAEESSGGIVGAIRGMAGKLLGGGGSALLTKLSSLGLSAEQIQAFIPRVMEFLKGKLPDAVVKQVSGLLPAPKEATV